MSVAARSIGSDLLTGAACGLVGGLAATWVMTRFQEAVPPDAFALLLGEREAGGSEDGSQSDEGGESEEAAPSTVRVARVISDAILDQPIPEEHEQTAGQVVHYAFGATMATFYGVLGELRPEVTRGFGLPFGAALWLGADEVGVSASGLAGPPWEHPPSTHLYGLAAHLVYGLTLEGVRRALRSFL